MFFRIHFIAMLFCLSTQTFSKIHSIDKKVFNSPEGQNIVLTYAEESKWVLHHILIKTGQLQETVSKIIFDSTNQLENYKSNNFSFPKIKTTLNKEEFVTTEINSRRIWEVKNEWNLAWEEKFSKWVKAVFHKDYFVENNLKTDCADAAFALRWIFSRINALPAANTMAGSHTLFSQDSFKAQWATLPTDNNWKQDQLFLAALDYILQHAFTGTLNIDSYPFELNKNTFKVGTIHLDGGHTMIISKIDTTGESAPIWKLSSTIPAKVRTLFEQVMLDQDITGKENGGLVRMRWPIKINNKWELIKKKNMPLYSEEQYTEAFKAGESSFTLALIKRLGIPFIPKNIIKLAGTSVKDNLIQRIQLVEDGYLFCANNQTNCSEGTQNYEDHSTPTRDKRILKSYSTVSDLAISLSSFDPTLETWWQDYKEKTIITINAIPLSLNYLEMALTYNFLSYHPKDTIAERWALTQEDIQSSFLKKTTRLFKKRESLINLATRCIGNNLCEKPNELWSNYNTFKFDAKLKKEIFYGSEILREKFPDISLKQASFDKIELIPFFSSEPFHSKELRNGLHMKNLNYIKLPSNKKVLQLKGDVFLVDENIIDISTQKLFVSGITEESLYHKESELLISYESKNVFSIDLKTLKKTSIQFFPKEVERINWLSTNFFMVTYCSLPTNNHKECNVSIYKINNNKPILKRSFISYEDHFSSPDGDTITWNSFSNNFFYNPTDNNGFSFIKNSSSLTSEIIYTYKNELNSVLIETPIFTNTFTIINDSYIYGSNINNNLILTYKNLLSNISCTLNYKSSFLNGFYNNGLLHIANVETNVQRIDHLDQLCKTTNLYLSETWLSPLQLGSVLFIRDQEKTLFIKENMLTEIPLERGETVIQFHQENISTVTSNQETGVTSARTLSIPELKENSMDMYNLEYLCKKEYSNFSVCPTVGNYKKYLYAVKFDLNTYEMNENYHTLNDEFFASNHYIEKPMVTSTSANGDVIRSPQNSSIGFNLTGRQFSVHTGFTFNPIGNTLYYFRE